ncbi:hypothetical protein BTH55_03095 [Lactobacillus delbrueckii subsp. bulgaricus]|nr:hypothetical protein [Lactobacillus delbrueckii subsp. bulgaricus]MBT8856843.1 hypothetical protein [Lactobacillus delbrueckii subsp. bulgaricus]MBT8866566.1 hypothetical protein [Lactobacillus delbrueckii subsp. bulgaricus]
MAVIMPLMRSITPFTPFATYSLMPVQISRTIDFMPFQASLKIRLISFQTPFQLPLRMSVPSLRMSPMILSPYFKMSLMAFQAVLRMIPIDLQVVDQTLFIKPIALVIRLLIVIMDIRTRPMITCSRGDIRTYRILRAPTTTLEIRSQSV